MKIHSLQIIITAASLLAGTVLAASAENTPKPKQQDAVVAPPKPQMDKTYTKPAKQETDKAYTKPSKQRTPAKSVKKNPATSNDKTEKHINTTPDKRETAARQTTDKTPKEDQSDQIPQETANRIAVLRAMLAELEEAEDPDHIIDDSNPHAERLQDPDAIKDAIHQLKQGEDICTRCLMACGAAD